VQVLYLPANPWIAEVIFFGMDQLSIYFLGVHPGCVPIVDGIDHPEEQAAGIGFQPETLKSPLTGFSHQHIIPSVGCNKRAKIPASA
jgi:hypothetical protein